MNRTTMFSSPGSADKLVLRPDLIGAFGRNDWEALLQGFEVEKRLEAVRDMRLAVPDALFSEDRDEEEDENELVTSTSTSQMETVRRIRTVLDLCPQLTKICVPCRYATQVLDKLTHKSLVELEIHGVPESQPDRASPSVADIIVMHCLSHGNTLQRLVLWGDEEGEVYPTLSSLSLSQCLQSASLTHLELKAMEVVPCEAVPPRLLGQALRRNTTLELFRARCGRMPEAILMEIGLALQQENRTLYYVDIGNLQGVSDAVAQTFTGIMASGNTTFRSLECNLNSISNFNFMSLKHMFCMDVSDNLIGDEGCLVLASCLPGASLQRLNLADNEIHRVGASAIAWGMRQAKYLNIVNICDNPILQDCDTTSIRSPVARSVLQKVQAEPAYAHGFLALLCASLQDHQNLSILNLAATGLTDAQGPLLALLLRVSPVQNIHLGRNSLGDETCGHLYSVLGEDGSRLTSLSMQMNSFGALGFYTLWQGVLRTNSRLQNVQVGLRSHNVYGSPRGQRDVDIALRLNKAGRVRLLRDRRATAQEWLECLFGVVDDVDCSFALLRENPTLCSLGGTR